VLALVVDQGGPKLPPLGFEDKLWSSKRDGNRATMPVGSSMQDLIRCLNNKTGVGALNKRVVDRTGLQGQYNIRLTYDVEPDPDHPNLELLDIDFPSELKKLGLRLEPAKAPIDFLVIAKGCPLKSQGRVSRYPLHLFAAWRLCVIIFFQFLHDLRDTVL